MSDHMATKANLRNLGLVLNDERNLTPRAKFIFEPPVTLGATVFITGATIGAYSYMRSGNVHSVAKIGRFCSIAPGVEIGPSNHPTSFLSSHPFQYGASGFGYWPAFSTFDHKGLKIPPQEAKTAPVIGHDVWLGSHVTIARGVTIGNGAVVAACSVVSKDVKPYEIVGGVPAKHIRFRFDDETIAQLQALQWWNYEPKSLEGVPFDDIHAAIKEITARKKAGKLVPINNTLFEVQNGKITLR